MSPNRSSLGFDWPGRSDRDPLGHAIVLNKPAIANGRLTLPTLPGWGLQLDEALVQKIRCD